jgi:hypothetical protein
MNDTPLLIDLAAAEILADEEVRAWASEQRVFISSVIRGMEAERLAVATAVQDLAATAVWFEKFGGRDDDSEAAYLSEVATSDIYVGILGERYGAPLPSGYSATHAEYREAVRRGLRISVWASSGALSGPQRDFLDEVRVFRTTGTYSSAEELASGVSERLLALAADSFSPWVKIGRVVLRARRINHDGTDLEVVARVRSESVMAAIEQMRPDGTWRTSDDVVVTWGGRSVPVRVQSVRTETSAGRGGTVTFIGRCTERHATTLHDVAFDGRTPEELTELAVRIALFGDENPLGPMSFLAKFDNPFPLIESLGVPEDSAHAVAHLFLTELLVGSGRAEQITRLHVGPRHLGVRRVSLAWVPSRRHINTEPEPRQVEGDVCISS